MLKLAARNILRNRLRTSLTVGSVAFGVMALILAGGFVEDIYQQLGEALIHSQTGHIQIAKPEYFSAGSRSPERHRLETPEKVATRVSSLPEVVEVLARASFSGLLNNGRTDLAIVGEGVEPDKENRLGSQMRITSGRKLSASDMTGIMIGEGVAKALKLRPGDHATILANTAEGALGSLDVDVVGVFQTFSKDLDARAVRVPLAAAQELLGTHGANTLVLSLRSTIDTTVVADHLRPMLLRDGLELRTWQELNDFYDKTVRLYVQQFGVLQLIILTMVVLSVTNSVNMSVLERVAEFGTMKALGNRDRYVFGVIVTESVILGIAGASIGTVAAVSIAYTISRIGIPMPPPPNSELAYTAHILVVPSIVAIAFAIGLFAAFIAALLPARRVAKSNISNALSRPF